MLPINKFNCGKLLILFKILFLNLLFLIFFNFAKYNFNLLKIKINILKKGTNK